MALLSTSADSSVNGVPARNVYPGSRGSSLGNRGSGSGDYSTNWAKNALEGGIRDSTDTPMGNSEVEQAFQVGASGNPLMWLLALAALLWLLMWGARKLGTDSDFSNIKMTFYNVLTVSLMAIIGIPIFKAVFTKFKVPGLSAVVLSV